MLGVLPDNLGLVSITWIRQLKLYNFNSRGSSALFWLCEHCMHMHKLPYSHTHMHIIKNKILMNIKNRHGSVVAEFHFYCLTNRKDNLEKWLYVNMSLSTFLRLPTVYVSFQIAFIVKTSTKIIQFLNYFLYFHVF